MFRQFFIFALLLFTAIPAFAQENHVTPDPGFNAWLSANRYHTPDSPVRTTAVRPQTNSDDPTQGAFAAIRLTANLDQPASGFRNIALGGTAGYRYEKFTVAADVDGSDNNPARISFGADYQFANFRNVRFRAGVGYFKFGNGRNTDLQDDSLPARTVSITGVSRGPSTSGRILSDTQTAPVFSVGQSIARSDGSGADGGFGSLGANYRDWDGQLKVGNGEYVDFRLLYALWSTQDGRVSIRPVFNYAHRNIGASNQNFDLYAVGLQVGFGR